jgi:hypothetical protein
MPRRARQVLGAETIEFLDPEVVQRELTRIAGVRPELQRLTEATGARGYVALDAPDAVSGFRYSARANRDISAPPEFGEVAPVTDVQVEFWVRSLTKPGSADQAAVITATISAGINSTTYDTFLEAPGGNFNQANEFLIQDNRLVEAESWWSALVNCLSGSCATICLGALVTCGGAWAAYLLCVLVACGGCGTKCAACATCDCTWWCRWAVGCCDQ